MFSTNLTPSVSVALMASIPVLLVIAIVFFMRWFYCPRSSREWRMLLRYPETRAKLRQRKRRLDAIRSRQPGAILPGIPTSLRDFALEPLIRKGQFKAARNYIMEQIRRHRDAPEGTGRMRVYVQYLDLIEGA
jgi:hypothetical protein